MSNKETKIMNNILVALGEAGARAWRNTVGEGWMGKWRRITRDGMVQVHAGDVIVSFATHVTFGLSNDSADIVGYMPVVITPEMVGQKVAIFIGAEVKTAEGHATSGQKTWCEAVNRNGGRAGIVRTEDQAIDLVLGR